MLEIETKLLMSELKIVNSIYFQFPFIFILEARIRVWYNLMSYISHSHMILSWSHCHTITCHDGR